MKLTILTLVLFPIVTLAGFKYDPKTGNSYNIQKDAFGNTTIRGRNLHGGSSWSTKIDRKGNQKGFDSKGNSWSYDKGSNIYRNYGTGKTCMGSGKMRRCY